MEITEVKPLANAKTEMVSDSSLSIGNHKEMQGGSVVDDTRSSSLSDIDDGLDNDHDDDPTPKPDKPPTEIDSEAETERIDDSPHRLYKQKNIVLSSGTQEKSPSKLIYSTTIGEDGEVTVDQPAEDTPSRLPPNGASNGLIPSHAEPQLDSSTEEFTDSLGKKRKRSEDGTPSEDADAPLRKRTGSIKSDMNMNTPQSPEATVEPAEANEALPEDDADEIMNDPETQIDDGAVEDILENEMKPAAFKGKKGKKGKRKGKKVKEKEEGTERVEDAAELEGDNPDAIQSLEGDVFEDDDNDGGEEIEDAEAVARNEEEQAKKMSAMDSLGSIEKQFAAFKDRIYNERIAQLNGELTQLNAPTPFHPEYLRQVEAVRQYRNDKIEFEHKLLAYKIHALKVKSMAERSQLNTGFFQTAREVREEHMANASEAFFKIQKDRFRPEDSTPNYAYPFPTRRSQQITQQNAYNKEVSVLSGVAKYVGFPAAPTIEGARQSEMDDDLAKMGITTQVKSIVQSQAQAPQLPGAFPALSSSMSGPAAEEEFLEQTPWANPKHPVHRQHAQQMNRELSDQPRTGNSFTTPAAQKRVIDLSAPNGSASTIPENPSAPTSSIAGTPYDGEQDKNRLSTRQSLDAAQDTSLDDAAGSGSADHITDLPSTSNSPQGTRKVHQPILQPGQVFGRRKSTPTQSPQDTAITAASSATPAYSSSTSRLALFSPPSRAESVPQMSSTSSPLASLHQPLQGTGIAAGAGLGRMGAR